VICAGRGSGFTNSVLTVSGRRCRRFVVKMNCGPWASASSAHVGRLWDVQGLLTSMMVRDGLGAAAAPPGESDQSDDDDGDGGENDPGHEVAYLSASAGFDSTSVR